MTISDKEVIQIFKLRSEGKSLREIERLTGVSKTKVGEVLKNENTVLETLKIKNHCIWGSECKELCTPECKSYNNAICDIKASKRLEEFFAERKKRREKIKAYYEKKYAKRIEDDET